MVDADVDAPVGITPSTVLAMAGGLTRGVWLGSSQQALATDLQSKKEEGRMDRATALQSLRNARESRGVSYEDLAKAIGTKDAMVMRSATAARSSSVMASSRRSTAW